MKVDNVGEKAFCLVSHKALIITPPRDSISPHDVIWDKSRWDRIGSQIWRGANPAQFFFLLSVSGLTQFMNKLESVVDESYVNKNEIR